MLVSCMEIVGDKGAFVLLGNIIEGCVKDVLVEGEEQMEVVEIYDNVRPVHQPAAGRRMVHASTQPTGRLDDAGPCVSSEISRVS